MAVRGCAQSTTKRNKGSCPTTSGLGKTIHFGFRATGLASISGFSPHPCATRSLLLFRAGFKGMFPALQEGSNATKRLTKPPFGSRFLRAAIKTAALMNTLPANLRLVARFRAPTDKPSLRHFIRLRLSSCIIAFPLLLVPAVHAELKLPAIISDHMVLQRNLSNPFWGWDTPGTQVTLTFPGH